MPLTKNTKFIVVTGGVLSGLGKGIAAASIGKLLSHNYKVVPIKLDGYLNVDPGTMNPIEHGEVFVLDDGGEVDMDFGHYERFLNVQCKWDWNLTMGKVFKAIMEKERRGDFLGQTVQMIPHVTNYIVERMVELADAEHADVMLIEVGGTVGDMENELYIEAMRQLPTVVGRKNVMYVHLTYIPLLSMVGEQKSKPTQQSVSQLRARGIQPDIIIGRCEQPIETKIKRKIATFCGVEEKEVFTGIDIDSVYKIPLLFDEEGMTDSVRETLGIPVNPALEGWKSLLTQMPSRDVNIAICGKYTSLEDSYASVIEAIHHAAANHCLAVNLKWIETTDLERSDNLVKNRLENIDGVIVPGGFGSRGTEGKIAVVRYCRENNLPFLGLCYGLQLAVIEHARSLGMLDANSSEINPETEHAVIDLLPEQRNVTEKGATMRLGGHDIKVKPGTKAYDMFGDMIRLRFRHRYEVNPDYIETLEKQGLVFSGSTPDGRIMQILERPDHPFFMATQAHPELTSKLERPSRFFAEFLKAASVKTLQASLNL